MGSIVRLHGKRWKKKILLEGIRTKNTAAKTLLGHLGAKRLGKRQIPAVLKSQTNYSFVVGSPRLAQASEWLCACVTYTVAGSRAIAESLFAPQEAVLRWWAWGALCLLISF